MSLTQSAMPQVVELASIVKDNLACKHLVLSVEETLVNFLQDDTNPDGVLELEPMDPYKRRLLHCLADIFGFAHVSVGEGENRHLVLERCPESSIPSILVSDILFLYDEPQSLTMPHQLLRRTDSSPVLKAKSPSLHTLEEREAAYLAARERIFSVDVREIREPAKQKPRHVPAVARRMIAHALGQKINPGNQDGVVKDHKGYEEQTKGPDVQEKDKIDTNCSMEASKGTMSPPCKDVNSFGKAKNKNHRSGLSVNVQRKMPPEPPQKSCTGSSISENGTSGNGVKKEHSKEEHVGAAKRMFAHALGLQTARGGFLTK